MTTTDHGSSPPLGSTPRPRSPGLGPDGADDAHHVMTPLTVSRSRQGLAITGEIDESSFCFLKEALTALASGLSLVDIDLAGVEYCDVAGLRLIVRLTGAEGQEGNGHNGARRVVLHGAAPHLRAILGILEWDRRPGLVLD